MLFIIGTNPQISTEKQLETMQNTIADLTMSGLIHWLIIIAPIIWW